MKVGDAVQIDKYPNKIGIVIFAMPYWDKQGKFIEKTRCQIHWPNGCTTWEWDLELEVINESR